MQIVQRIADVLVPHVPAKILNPVVEIFSCVSTFFNVLNSKEMPEAMRCKPLSGQIQLARLFEYSLKNFADIGACHVFPFLIRLEKIGTVGKLFLVVPVKAAA